MEVRSEMLEVRFREFFNERPDSGIEPSTSRIAP